MATAVTAACPTCGAPVTFARRGPAITTCRHCNTFLVYAGGSTLPAQKFSRGPLAAQTGGVLALLCNLCGGPLPSLDPGAKVLTSTSAIPKRVVCAYCNHDADLPPSALEVLKLLLTKPSVAPPAYLSMGRAWTAIGVASAGVVVAALVQGTDRLDRKFEVSRDEVPWISPPFTVNSRSANFPKVTFASEVDGCVLFSIVDTGSKETRSEWAYVHDGSTYAYFSLSAGEYRFAVDEMVGLAHSTPLEVEVTSMGKSPVFLLIILANVLIWALVLDLRWSKGVFERSPKKSLVLRIIVALVIVACLVEVVHPLGEGAGALEPKKAQSAPSYCR